MATNDGQRLIICKIVQNYKKNGNQEKKTGKNNFSCHLLLRFVFISSALEKGLEMLWEMGSQIQVSRV